MELPLKISKIGDASALVQKAKWLEGKTLLEVQEEIKKSDPDSRVTTKGHVGYVIEKGFFGIKKNSEAKPDLENLGIEIKTCPLKYNKSRTKITVKEPLSLNIINYHKEVEKESIRESSIYGKSRKILFILYLHDSKKNRSEYPILKVFLWEMTEKVLKELEPDYNLIVGKIRQGLAHKIHQSEHDYLTLCPKHNGKFKDPHDRISKRTQPFSKEWAEVRAFRLKNRYMKIIINRVLKKPEDNRNWELKDFN